jgi:hypothetical protein
MLRIFKMKPSKQELERQFTAAKKQLMERWVYFCGTVNFKEDVTLVQRMKIFALPAHEFFQNEFPMLVAVSPDMFRLALSIAVIDSDSHSSKEVNAAVAELDKEDGI